MNPMTSMWINGILTAALAAVSAFTASGGHADTTTIVTAAAAGVSALNTVMHATSSSQPGPMGK